MGLSEQINSKGANHFKDRIKPWFCAWTESLVEAFSAQTGLLSDLRHPTRLGNVTNGTQDFIGIPISKYLGQVLADSFITVQ